MPVEGHLSGERVWFHDTRSPVRRMGLSAHPVDSTIVISLWQGDICTGTFRLPATEAARLISALAFGMTESQPRQGPTSDVGTNRHRRSWSELFRRLFARSPATTDAPLRLLK